MRKIKEIHHSHYSPIRDLITYSPLPSETIRQVDPFIFLNHHGPQKYEPNNDGLPFGPHPHRGMETVTFIIDGDIMHKDSVGNESIITAGGIQWMTAGRGLIHAEISSNNFKKNGGNLEILQLWINLPAKYKMTQPYYQGFQKEEIPTVTRDDGRVYIQLISGEWWENEGALKSLSNIHLSTIYFQQGGKLQIDIPKEENIFFYVVRGKLLSDDKQIEARQLIEFENNDSQLSVEALEASIILLGFAKPLNEPIVAQGPFVMNTQEEIHQAYYDYQHGVFGTWETFA